MKPRANIQRHLQRLNSASKVLVAHEVRAQAVIKRIANCIPPAAFEAVIAHVCNIYVNRDMIGAVVGVQPFGAEGLSGTGPTAGGPHYLVRFCVEQTLTVNTTAAGGNAALLASMP